MTANGVPFLTQIWLIGNTKFIAHNVFLNSCDFNLWPFGPKNNRTEALFRTDTAASLSQCDWRFCVITLSDRLAARQRTDRQANRQTDRQQW